MKEIQLNNNRKIKNYRKYSALVDDEDFDYLNQWKWCISMGYAVSRDKKENRIIRMHRLLMSTPEGMDTDHINGNKLDNRRSNLRITNRSNNNANRPMQANNTSGYKGVSWTKKRKVWEVHIAKNCKDYHLGYFQSKVKAAKAYNIKAKELFGDFARLNTI